MPTRFAGKAATQATYPALESAARELASDNIMCAVMLTGVLFLQVRTLIAWRGLLVLMIGWTLLLQNGHDQGKEKRRRSQGERCTSLDYGRTTSSHIHAI